MNTNYKHTETLIAFWKSPKSQRRNLKPLIEEDRQCNGHKKKDNTINTILHRKQIEQHERHWKPAENSGAPELWAVSIHMIVLSFFLWPLHCLSSSINGFRLRRCDFGLFQNIITVCELYIKVQKVKLQLWVVNSFDFMHKIWSAVRIVIVIEPYNNRERMLHNFETSNIWPLLYRNQEEFRRHIS
jgi:hypothetical protein